MGSGASHRQVVVKPVDEVASFLQDLLGRRLVAYMAGAEDAKTVSGWAGGEVGSVGQEREEHLRTAYEVAHLLVQFDSPGLVEAWFIGLDPQLDDVSPAETIREGKLKEAKAAARAFVAGG
ncbi:MAG: XRE family transcriptional regulator [Actinomycetota bacterium]|nr:XRE family transcriptional regulator [Actinomycetota bacterium]MDP9477797.1 XRE family transcriptional regulator [Actinomycetota bacterium]